MYLYYITICFAFKTLFTSGMLTNAAETALKNKKNRNREDREKTAYL